MLSLLVVNVQFACAKQKDTIAQPSNTVKYESDFDAEKDYDIEDFSYNISDEQLEESKEDEEIDNTKTFDDKVINSGHFTSGTATRTWIPWNRFKQ